MPEIMFGVDFHAAASRQDFQQPVPLMVAAMSGPGLAVAAARADVVGFSGLRQIPGAAPGTFTLVDSVTTHQPSMEALGQVIAAYRGGTS